MSAQQKKHPFDFKTQYGLGFNPQDDEIVVDFFCGGGGAGTGLEMGLGRTVNVAKNHSPQAISMHTVNHPGAQHFTTDVFEGDPDTECGGKAVGWFHMSPDCTHHSQAAGGQPRKREIRNLSWIGLKWAGMKRPRVISLENVKQILQWGRLIAKRDKTTGRVVKLSGDVAAPYEVVPVGQQFLIPDPKQRGRTWRRFVALLEGMGYVVEWKVIKACDFGAPTSRERLFMIARCDGQPIMWPEPTHAKNPVKGQQKWKTAADCIDFTDLGKSIFGRKGPGPGHPAPRCQGHEEVCHRQRVAIHCADCKLVWGNGAVCRRAAAHRHVLPEGRRLLGGQPDHCPGNPPRQRPNQ